MPARIRNAFIWWIDRLSSLGFVSSDGSRVRKGKDWVVETLPITSQRNGDDYSCGMLAVNSLEHALLHEPLIASNAQAIAHLRIRSFLEICQLHLEDVSDTIRLKNRSIPYQYSSV